MNTARVFRSGNGQAVRLPKEFRLKTGEVEIFRRGKEIVLREREPNLERAFDIISDLPEDLEVPGRDLDRPQKRRGCRQWSPAFSWIPTLCIYIRQKRPEQVLRRFRKLRAGEAALSVITYGELMYEAEKSAQRESALERLRDLETLLPALPLPETAAQKCGAIRARLESMGEMIGNNDLWIAEHALTAGLILVTNNEREFSEYRDSKFETGPCSARINAILPCAGRAFEALSVSPPC
jgi:tRNA(fMet)-specific endonuclease VapC